MMGSLLVNVLTIGALLLLSGCAVFDGLGEDSSHLQVTNKCDVDIGQHALVDGNDKSSVIEKVDVMPDCTVRISFEQGVEPE